MMKIFKSWNAAHSQLHFTLDAPEFFFSSIYRKFRSDINAKALLILQSMQNLLPSFNRRHQER